MKCPNCQKEINDSEIAKSLRSKVKNNIRGDSEYYRKISLKRKIFQGKPEDKPQ